MTIAPIQSSTKILFTLSLLSFNFLPGCASGPGPDPWEKSNRAIYKFNDTLDRIALKPVADFYVKVTPEPVRTGLHNAFNNLGYFNVILNDVLQFKLGQGLSDTGRMALNSSFGLAGVFDIATPLHMPVHENDFGVTLGTWGVQQGNYMVLPLLGPTTVRDAPGIGVTILTNPLTWINPPLAATIPLAAVDGIDARSRADTLFKFRGDTALDPYIFTRDAYLQYRAGLVNDGHPPTPTTTPSIYDEDLDTTRPATQPATQPAK